MLGEISPFLMVVLIVLIVTVGRTYRARYKALSEAPPAENAEALRLRGEVTRLNERLAVLERIATDPAKRLSSEIDALDDRRK